jgi:predicted transcriptional regulator
MSNTFRDSEEVDRLLGHDNNASKVIDVEVKNVIKGSGNHGKHDRGDKREGEQLRDTESKADVGVLAEILGNKTAGALLGIGPTQVSQYKNGKNGSNVTDIELRKEMDQRLGVLEEKAVDKIDLFLEMINNERVEALKANDMASSAEKMVNVLDKLRRRNEKSTELANKPIIHIHGPAMVKADQYLTKEV